MKKLALTGSLWFLVFAPGVDLLDMTPQLAVALPTVERVLQTGTIYHVERLGDQAWLFIRIAPRRLVTIERLADRLELALGTDRVTNVGTFGVVIVDLDHPEADRFDQLAIVHTLRGALRGTE